MTARKFKKVAHQRTAAFIIEKRNDATSLQPIFHWQNLRIELEIPISVAGRGP